MICETIRKGSECAFMTKKGCGYNGGACHQALEACAGCNRIVVVSEARYCSSCPDPAVKWKLGNCNLATHIVKETAQAAKVNPLKASKRASR